MKIASRYLPPARVRARGGFGHHRLRAPRSRLAPPWSEKAARLFLAGGSCKWR